MLSIIDIIEDTTVDGPGFRTAIYAAGCPNQCPGCHNPESWDINKGRPVPTEEILEKVLADDFADVTFSGGDPMFQPENVCICLILLSFCFLYKRVIIIENDFIFFQ